MTKRYQECNSIEKMWRCRWYLLVPFRYIHYVVCDMLQKPPFRGFYGLGVMGNPWEFWWKMAVGDTHHDMEFYYTMEEVKTRFKEKHENNNV